MKMKKVVLSVFCVMAMAIATNAQEAAAPKQELTKEQKAAQKEAKLKAEYDVFVKAGLSDSEITQVRAVNTEMDQKAKEVKKDAQLSDDEKKAKVRELSAEKKTKIIAIIGETKYKNWQQARKDAAAAAKVE